MSNKKSPYLIYVQNKKLGMNLNETIGMTAPLIAIDKLNC